ncbi:hypothetical protein HDV00_000080 [Rhizophlyctis rosea]|nr:hypothetical protein HDV00_000080 [Rhizophlyctis rosea]
MLIQRALSLLLITICASPCAPQGFQRSLGPPTSQSIGAPVTTSFTPSVPTTAFPAIFPTSSTAPIFGSIPTVAFPTSESNLLTSITTITFPTTDIQPPSPSLPPSPPSSPTFDQQPPTSTPPFASGPWTTANLIYPTTPNANVIWQTGTTVPITWLLPTPSDPAAANVAWLHIELGIGQNTTVTPAGVVVAEWVPYPTVTSISWNVPTALESKAYALIIVGVDAAGRKMYGPNWSTWFTVVGGPQAKLGNEPGAAKTSDATTGSGTQSAEGPGFTEPLNVVASMGERTWSCSVPVITLLAAITCLCI